MADPKHTPGPWRWTAEGYLRSDAPHLTRDVWTIPMCEEDQALIAAAPELLAALRGVTDLCSEEAVHDYTDDLGSHDPSRCRHCRCLSAIAKAEGRAP